jgi:S-adenosylmethionine:tRNA ribosyltransferase-isomerase
MNPKKIQIEEYNYDLPQYKIAVKPAEIRDQSKLLVYRNGEISHGIFNEITTELREKDLLIANNTRVIPARIIFTKPTGGVIEIFCLEPANTSHQDAMSSTRSIKWKCLVGGAKKWKGNSTLSLSFILHGKEVTLNASRLEQYADHALIDFIWSPPEFTFSEILESTGKIPLPPYFSRKPEDWDNERYQTVFARYQGSVAAPTAALHFTNQTFENLERKGVGINYITLHVGAGTFKPVSSKELEGHEMHGERFSVHKDVIRKLIDRSEGRIVVVGTTSMRTMESLYWLGVKIIENGPWSANTIPTIGQWDAYETKEDISTADALNALLSYCRNSNRDVIEAQTSIMIAPGYQFKICDGLITNFHMPKSTLLVLISAFIGNDWKNVYDYALNNEFRFLSYGDSSLLWRKSEA